MTEPWDAELFRVPDISWQTQTPPTQRPVPVTYVRELEVGDEVTVGVPGHYFIDGQVIAVAERSWIKLDGREGEHETIAVAAPFAYWLAKAFPRAGLTMQWWPTEHCWMYRDVVVAEDREGQRAMAGSDSQSWLDHVQSTLHEPPARHARPARAAGLLTGRTVRLQHERGSWSWWVAVSEPVDADANFVVHVMRPSDYWLAQVAFEPIEKVEVVPLHRLYTYG